jgi:hypothetical protein
MSDDALEPYGMQTNHAGLVHARPGVEHISMLSDRAVRKLDSNLGTVHMSVRRIPLSTLALQLGVAKWVKYGWQLQISVVGRHFESFDEVKRESRFPSTRNSLSSI